jgi:aminoacylase
MDENNKRDANYVEEFREYLQIDTRQPDPDYSFAINYLKNKCVPLGFNWDVKEYVKGKPILILTLKGTEMSKPSIVLNSHVDVVPTVDEQWKYHPMSAQIEDGKIYARGSQDMKCVGMAYIHAIQNLISKKVTFKRTIHLLFVPDEEIGGNDGMGKLVADSDYWKSLNVGVVLDEGVPSPTSQYFVFNRERSVLWLQVTVSGPAGHGSLLTSGTAAERLTELLFKINQFRQSQQKKLIEEKGRLGNITSINVTNIKSNSTQINVVPSKFFVEIDVRIGPDFKSESEFLKHFEENFMNDHASYKICMRNDALNNMSQDPQYLNIIKESLKEEGFELGIFPGSTDSKYIRDKGIDAYGVSLFRNTPILAHDHSEFLGVEEYLRGVEMYEKLILNLSKE